MLKSFAVLAFFSLNTIFTHAQNLSSLSFGTDSTFEIATWNIEWFPKNGQTSVSAVGEIIGALDVDIWALQEIKDSSDLKSAIGNLNTYKVDFGTVQFRGLAYVYNTETIKNVKTYHLFSESQYRSPLPRAPFVIEFEYKDTLMRIVDNHYKCCGNGRWDKTDAGDEENRRYTGHRLIIDYMDSVWANERVFVVGDLNDILTDSRENNIFQNELTDSQNYKFVDLYVEQSQSNNWSYPSWPSHLDHILINKPLLADYSRATTITKCIKVEEKLQGGWSEYDRDISDHRPVVYQFSFDNPDLEDEKDTTTSIANEKPMESVVIYPNPSDSNIRLTGLDKTEIKAVTILDVQGRKVKDISGDVDEINVSDLDAGNYILRIETSAEIIKQQFQVK